MNDSDDEDSDDDETPRLDNFFSDSDDDSDSSESLHQQVLQLHAGESAAGGPGSNGTAYKYRGERRRY